MYPPWLFDVQLVHNGRNQHDGESTKDRLVCLEAIVDTLQPDLESLAKNTKINSIEMASVKQTCAEFVSEFSDKLSKVTKDVAVLVEVLKGDVVNLEKKIGLLKRAVGNTSQVEDRPSKVKVPEPRLITELEMLKSWRTFCGIQSIIFELLVYMKQSESLSRACTLRVMLRCGGGAIFKRMLKRNN